MIGDALDCPPLNKAEETAAVHILAEKTSPLLNIAEHSAPLHKPVEKIAPQWNNGGDCTAHESEQTPPIQNISDLSSLKQNIAEQSALLQNVL